MNQLAEITHRYYATQQSLRHVFGAPKWVLVALPLLAVLSSWQFFRLLEASGRNGGVAPLGQALLLIVLETAFVGCAFLVNQARERRAVERISEIVCPDGPAFPSIHAARTAYLTHLFHRSPTEFLTLAENVRKAHEHVSSSHRGFAFTLENVLSRIYNPEAKARVITLCVATGTMITALTLFDAANRGLAVEWLVALSPVWLPLWLTGVLLLATLGFGLEIIFATLRQACDSISRVHSTPAELNSALVRFTLRDLCRYHVWVPEVPNPVPPSPKSINSPLSAGN